MKVLWGIGVLIAAGFFGMTFFLFQGGYIIVKLPWFSYPAFFVKGDNSCDLSREIVCSVWKRDRVVEGRRKVLIPSDNVSESIRRVVAAWLAVAADEKVIAEEVKIVSVGLTSQATVTLLDFDKSFIDNNLSTYDRWQLVESLLTTLRAAGLVLEGVYFLQNNQFLQDDYLDFCQRWPIGGYSS